MYVHKKIVVLLIVFFIFLICNIVPVQASELDNACNTMSSREIVVQFKGDNASLGDLPLVDVPVSRLLTGKNIKVFLIPESLDYEATLRKVQQLPNVQSAEQNGVRCVMKTMEGEPDYSNQWYLDQIDMEKAKGLIPNTSDITIAVLDTGVNANHPELEGRILPGNDFANNDAQPEDDNGHGTFVAGIIAANIDGAGIAGMAEHVKILPVKIGKNNGTMTHSDIIEGIYYAIEQGVDIINMSYAGSTVHKLEKQALEEAHKQGIVLVAATGNHGSDRLMYPASYPMVISVGAMKKVNLAGYIPRLYRASFSGFGPMIDISAPGHKIYSTSHEGGYITDEGTSFAAPMVSSLAAMLKAAHPTWDTATIEWAIEKGAINSDLSSGLWEEQLGYGIINVYESLILEDPVLSADVPNDRINAQVITINQAIQEYIHLPQDVDWYQFSLAQEADITFVLDGLDSNLLLEMEIYQKDRDNSVHHMQHIENREAVSISLEKGDYYVKVYERASHWSTNPYEVTISSDQFKMVPLKIKEVSHVFEGTTTITGITNPYTKVIVKGDETRTGISDHKGNFTIEIFETEQGDDLSIFAMNGAGIKSPVLNRTVKAFFDDVFLYKEQIRTLSERSILNGYPDGSFKPTQPIKKIHAIQILLHALKNGTTNKDFLNDQEYQVGTILGVSQGQYGYESLVKAYHLDLLDNIAGRASEELTRGEMAQLLVNAYKIPISGETTFPFKDVDPNSPIYGAINALGTNGVVKGYRDGSFRPDEPIRRDHFAVLLSKVMSSNY